MKSSAEKASTAPCTADGQRARDAGSALRLALAVLALAALTSGALAARANAQEAAAVLAQVGTANDTEKKIPGLDPWNAPVESLPAWDPANAPPRLQPRAKRHLEFIQAGVPVEYRSRRNPFPNAQKFIDEGGQVYRANCLACHGRLGRGDGDAGLDLVPSPALLSRMMDVQGTVDEYLLWSIAEGGKPFGTAMPAFKGRLSEDQIWQVIAYMRAGFPPAAN
ncbi:cytochrome c [Pelagibius sp. 7325]|uniref:c-type cytochrome n=1 Tax=Pelagibius sp. 7325 TaxID=3131994 RepID=UPI0030EECD68